MAYDDGYYYGQCKIVCEAETVADNGRTVAITDGTNTWSKALSDKMAEFLVPGRGRYTVTLLDGSVNKYTTVVDAGYGDCIHVMLANGYNEVTQKQFDSQVGSFIFETNSDGVAGYRRGGADTFHPFKVGDGDSFEFLSRNVSMRGLKAKPKIRAIYWWSWNGSSMTAMIWNSKMITDGTVYGISRNNVNSTPVSSLGIQTYDDGFSFNVPTSYDVAYVYVAVDY